MGSNSGAELYGVSADGQKYSGMINPSASPSSGDLGYWSYIGNAPTDVSKQISAIGPYKNLAGFFLLNDGSFISLAVNTTTNQVNFLYIKKR